MTERQRYEDVLRRSEQRSVFAQPWWLDIVCDGPSGWRPTVVGAREHGAASAAWPLPTRTLRRGDVAFWVPYTPFLGPLLTAHDDVHEYVDQLGRVADHVADYAHVEAACMPELHYWTPLAWRAFTQTTRTTWRIDASDTIAQVRARMRKKTRGALRAAERDGLVVAAGGADELLAACDATFARQSMVVPARETLRRLASAAIERGAGEVVTVRTRDGELASAGLFVFDDRWTWNLANGRCDAGDTAVGAPTLLLDQAIERALARGTGFDFEGSMIQPIERFVRSFGGRPVSYSVLARSTPAWRRHVARKRQLKRMLRR